jgi:hypothetical protein
LKKSRATPKKQTLTNQEVVVVAAFLVGAKKEAADTEDIAVKANEIAPGRFTWLKYKDQINIDRVRKRLWDAAKSDKGAFLIGSEKSGWRLTKAGLDFVRRVTRKGAAPKQEQREASSQTERAARTREIHRMMSETAFLKIKEGKADLISKADAERFFRIDDYVTGKSRTAKIERFRIMVARNKELSAAIDVLAKLVGE